MTRIQTSSIYHQDKYSDEVITKFHEDPLKKIKALLWTQGFWMIWPSDLVFESTLPIFELDLDIGHKHILIKSHDDSIENKASTVYSRFL